MLRIAHVVTLVGSIGVAGLLLSLVPGSVAYAVATEYEITGTGSIDPGLPLQGTSWTHSHVTFSFDAVGAGTESGAYLNCTYAADSDINESLNDGHGTGTVIAGPNCDMSGTIEYNRTGEITTLDGTVTVNGNRGEIIHSALTWYPTSINPTTSYLVSGEITVQDPLPLPSALPTAPVTVPPLPPPSGSTCNVVNAAGVCVGVTTGAVAQTVSVAGPQASGGSYHVVGAVDMYQVPLPTGGTATFPCVVLTVDSTGSPGCTGLSATFVSRVATLVDQYAIGSTPLATVRVCTATYTVTVAGFGVQNVPADTLC